jgi:hypothetical protein
MNMQRLRRRIFICILFFMTALILSGVTAFPLVTEVTWFEKHISLFPSFLHEWIHTVYNGVVATDANYPFIAYGTDWLAFAHIVIALAFIGPLRDPIRNKWVIEWGILNCILILPLAFIAGPVRHIPFFHQLIDSSFGLVGLIPLLIARKDIRTLEKISQS